VRAHWTELEDAADVCDEIVELITAQLGPLALEKAGKKRTTTLGRLGYDDAINKFTRDALKATAPEDRAALGKAMRAAEQDWAKINAAEREAAAKAVGETQREAGPAVGAAAGPIIAANVETMIGRASADTAKLLSRRGSRALTPTDKIVVQFARDSQTQFVADEYGRRADRFSALSRTIVAKGLGEGLDSHEIARSLQTSLQQVGVDRGLWYWRMIASVQMSRARSYGQLRSFRDAGIERCIFTAVLDEKTTEQCRFLDKQIFSVGRALDRFERTAKLEDPADLFDLQPFMRMGKAADGKGILYFMAGGSKHSVALVDKAGYGASDRVGEYTPLMSSEQLQDAGLCTPPLHELCRSILLPA
jgi:hypothetical protein